MSENRYSCSVHYADRLQAKIRKTSPVCVGLDPALRRLPKGIAASPEGAGEFCRGIVDAVSDTACAIKLQLAFFEVLGWEGMRVFWDVAEHSKRRGLLVLADGKRGDIGSTAEAYADAYLGAGSPIDALTVNPYLGSDGVQPFIERCVKNGKGIYVLVKTSNPSSGELQDLTVGDESVHEHLAQLVESWAMHYLGTETRLSCVGAVVGATYPEELKYVRTIMPHVPLLLPGYGAQGASAGDCRHGFLADGTGAIVVAARSIIFASGGTDWREAAMNAAKTMKADLLAALKR